MGALIGSILTFLVAFFGIIFGLTGLLVGVILSLMEFLLAGPFLIILVVLGLFFWHPLLWIGLLIGIFYIYRIYKKERYIKIRRR